MTASAASLFVLGNSAALLLAAVVASGLCRDRSLALRWVGLIGAYLLITCLTTLVIGLAGWLKPWSPTLAVGVAALACLGFRRKSTAAALRSFVPEIDRDHCREELGTLLTPMLALFVGLASVWIVKYSLLGTFLTFDDRTYHAPSLVHWMETGRIALTVFSYQSYYAFNAEMLPLWFMLPFQNDAAVPLTGLIYAALFVLLSLEFGRRWQLPMWCRLVPAVLFLSSIEIVSQCNWFADVDVAAPVTLLAALAIGCRDSSPARRRQVMFAGAIVGFAAGMKPTFAPFAGILMIIVAGRIFLRSRLSDGQLPKPPSIERLSFFGTIANALGFFLAASCAGGYWYLRNFALTGNPLYPARIGPFPGPFTPEEQSATTLAHAISNGEFEGPDYGALGEMIFSWPATHAMLAAFAVVVCGLAVVRIRKDQAAGATAATAVTITTFAVLCVAMTPWIPFSARGDDGNFYLEGSSRYLTLAYLCGFLLLPRLLAWVESPELRGGEQWMVFAGLVFLLTIPLGVALDLRFALAGLAVAIIAHAGLQWLTSSRRKLANFIFTVGGRPMVWLAAVSAVLLFATAAAPINLRSTDRIHLEGKWMNEQIEALPTGSTVAMYYGLRSEIYTLYGRRYQLDPVRLRADGLPAEALHLRRAHRDDETIFEKAFDLRTDINPKIFLSNLQTTGIDFIVTPAMPHNDDAWPVQHAWLKQLGISIHRQSDDAVIWDLRSEEDRGNVATNEPP
jgi:hypothetical protein